MFMTYTKLTKLLSVLLAVAMLAVMLPVFAVSALDHPGYDEAPASLTKENGNLAAGAAVFSNFGEGYDAGHRDVNWDWDARLLTDGTMNTTDVKCSQKGNGGYHSDATKVSGVIGNRFRTEWVGVDLGSTQIFDEVVIYPCRDKDGLVHSFPVVFSIEVADDKDGTWTTVYSSGNSGDAFEFAPLTFRFDDVEARYVRIRSQLLNKDENNAYYMKLCEFAVYDANASYSPNLALDADFSFEGGLTGNGDWLVQYVNDGNHANMLPVGNQNQGQFVGWHSRTDSLNAETWFKFDFREVKAVDRVVIYPATERFSVPNTNQNQNYKGNDNLYIPDSITVSVSTDGVTFIPVTVDVPYEKVTEYKPIELTFDAVEARYVKIDMVRTNHVKISEVEIFGEGNRYNPGVVTVPELNTNLAIGAQVIASSSIDHGFGLDWDRSNLNNGVIAEPHGGGYTCYGTDANPWVGYQFETLTRVNQIVLYSAPILNIENKGNDIGAWSGIPKIFKVEYSINGTQWKTIKTVELGATPPMTDQSAYTVTFDAVDAKAIRIYAVETYEKLTDGKQHYMQLAEMEVKLVASEIGVTEESAMFAGYLQKRNTVNIDGVLVSGQHDLRVLLVGDMEKMNAVSTAVVAISFALTDGKTKTTTFTLGGTDSDFGLYKTIKADGELYQAIEGDAIFGAVITDIPNGAYTAVTVTITDGADPSVVLYTGTATVTE